MATEVKRRRGTTTQHDSFTGAEGEITVDLTKDTLVVHDGSTQAGFPLLREDFSNAPAEIDVQNSTIEASEFIGDLRGAVRFRAKAVDTNISKGDAVYISGIDGNTPTVGLADADAAAKMPAFGLAAADINENATGEIITFGTLSGVDTSSFSVGDILYIDTSSSVGSTLTATAPAGESAQIQNIGKVQRSHATVGSIKVGGAGRSNATPNLNQDKIFLGDSNNRAVSTALSSIGLTSFNDDSTFLKDADFSSNGLMKRTGAGTYAIVTDNSSNWDTAYSWGDHSTAGYLTSYSETDTLSDVTGRGASTTDTVSFDKSSASSGNALRVLGAAGNIDFSYLGTQISFSAQSTITAGTNDLYLDGGQVVVDTNLYNDGDATVTGSITAGSIVKDGGSSSQFLKADGSVDGNTYLTAVPSEYLTETEGDARYLQLTGGTISSNLIISGNLTVSGTTTTVNTETIKLADNIIMLNSNFEGETPSESSGIEIERGPSNTNKQFLWNETNDRWQTDDALYVSGALTASGDLSVTGGDITLGTDSIASNINSVGDVLVLKVDSNENTGGSPNIQFKVGAATELTINGSTATFAGDLDVGGDLQFSGNTLISTDTSDASDNAQIIISGGGASGDTRGASVHVSGNEHGNGGLLQLRAGSGSISQIRSYTSGSERMRIDSSGTIKGIGTYTAGNSIKIFEAERSGGAVASNWSYDDATTDMSLGTSTAHRFSLKTSNTNRLTIDSSGNVGIGETSPAQTLEIHNSDASDYTDFGLKGTGHKYVIGVGNDSVATVNDKLYFYDNDNTAFRMVLDTSGSVGINNTSPSSSYKLDVNGAGHFVNDLILDEDLVVADNIYLSDTNTALLEGGSNSVKIQTDSGFIELGPKNTSYSHIETDRDQFYFNKKLIVNSGVVSSYDEDLQLRRAGISADRITIKDASIDFDLNSTTEFQITTEAVIAKQTMKLESVSEDNSTTTALFHSSGQTIVRRTLGSNAFNSTAFLTSSSFTVADDDTNTTNVATNGSLTISGGTGIDVAVTSGTVTITSTVTDTDTNTFVNAASFNTGDGVLTLTKNNSSTVTADLDGRYLELGGGTLTGALNSNSEIKTTDHFTTDSGELLNLNQSSWTNEPNHFVLYNAWRSTTGDYLLAKASGNSTGDTHGALLIADNGLYYGKHAAAQTANDSATAPLNSTLLYFRSGGSYLNSDLEVTGDLEAGGNITANGNSAFVRVENTSSNIAVQLLSDSSGDGQIRVNDSSGNTKVFLYGEAGGDAYFNAGGNVGIGNTAPAQKLVVNGGIHAYGNITTPASGTYGLLMDYYLDTSRFWSRGTSGTNGRGAFSFNQLKADNTSQITSFALDTSGNASFNYDLQVDGDVLVGKISAGIATVGVELKSDGNLVATRQGVVASLNREDSDGDVLDIRKDTTTVGTLGNAGADLFINSSGSKLLFKVAGTTEATLNSNYLLVSASNENVYNGTATGTAIGNGYIFSGRSADAPLYLNRISTDGHIAQFRKNGSAVGSIGTLGGDFFIASTSGDDAGFRMDGANNVIYASNSTGNARDNAIDLGASTVRWKDLHLGGDAYIDDNIVFSAASSKIKTDLSSGGTTRTAEIELYNGSNGAIKYMTTNSSTGGHEFYTQGTKRFEVKKDGDVDISNDLIVDGDVLVGKTSAGLGTVGHEFDSLGYAYHTRNSEIALALNRKSTDGKILEFYKDTSTVGSIGTANGDLFIGTTNGSDECYLRFAFGGVGMVPATSAGLANDNALDLGASNARFKDLYLGGDANIDGDVSMVDGNASGKFAVKSAGVHASYDLYNDGTSYFNGGVIVDAGFTQSGGAISSFSGAVNIAGKLTLDSGSLTNGIINTPASLRINIDSNNNNTGEKFVIGHNQDSINNNNELFVVNESGNVGIGTNSPNAKLEVETGTYSASVATANFINGNNPVRVSYDTVVVAQTDVPTLSIVETVDGTQETEQKLTMSVGDGSSVIGTSSTVTNGLYINVNRPTNSKGYQTTAGTTSARFLNNGNSIFYGDVGIGATSITSGFKTEISGGFLRVGDTQGEDAVEMGWFSGGNRGFIQVYDRGDSAFRDLLINDSLLIKGGGNVGIGETDPAQKLHVNSGSANFVARFESTDDKASILLEDDDTLNYIHSQNGFMSLGGDSGLDVGNLNIHSTNGNVGIGSTNPSNTLVLRRASSGQTEHGLRLEYVEDAAPTQTSSAVLVGDYGLKFKNYNSGRDFVFETGNVGIGTASPAGKLMVREDSAGNPTRIIVSNNGSVQSGTSARMSFYEGTSEKNYIERRRDGSGDFAFVSSADDNPFVFENASGEFLTFVNSRVGIGTNSPSSMLNINTTGTANYGLKLSRHDSATDGFEFTYTPSSAEAFIENKYPTSSGQVYGDIRFRTNQGGTQTTSMTIKADGNYLQVSNGITFGSDTANANRLDDYEEGTWSPTINGTADNVDGVVYDTDVRFGRYTKIGDTVHLWGRLRTDALTWFSTSTNAIYIGGLPFDGANVIGNGTITFAGTVGYANNWDGDIPQYCAMTGGASDRIYLYYQASHGSSWSLINPNDTEGGSNGNDIMFQITYKV